MSTVSQKNPFHASERAAQARAGVGDVAKWAASFIRDYLPDQHRTFFGAQPFLVVSSADDRGRVWVTIAEGSDGFVTSPNPRQLRLGTTIDETDPLAAAFGSGSNVGVVGIELATRRRNRFSGFISPDAAGYVIDIHQSYGNCPQHIHERSVSRVERRDTVVAHTGYVLSDKQIAQIRAADTMFIGSGYSRTQDETESDPASEGFDASHRGGAPGFIRVVNERHLQIPDYSGNNFFNTIGNLMSNPQVGLLFVDFETGSLLHVNGRADVDWSAKNSHDPDAIRMINVEIDTVIERPGALSLRWHKRKDLTRQLRFERKVQESDGIASFYFSPADGKPLEPFSPGQHLPIQLDIPGQPNNVARSYSLSGPVSERNTYRLTVKREDNGQVSRLLHDGLQSGDIIEASAPSGDFVAPTGSAPLVLVSAGVGMTPFVPVLHFYAELGRTVWYVHGTRNGRHHALASEIKGLLRSHKNLRQQVYYSRPDPDDSLGQDFDGQGRISAQQLVELSPDPRTHYMICGPAQFLSDIQTGLAAKGIPDKQIHVETFGPVGT